jgi:hypothetical protein
VLYCETKIVSKGRIKEEEEEKFCKKFLLYFRFSLTSFFLDIPADAILELFGQTFFEYCQDSGYDKILQVLGATPRDFLQVIYYLIDTYRTVKISFRSLRIIEKARRDGRYFLN